jgi:hypothetical protein
VENMVGMYNNFHLKPLSQNYSMYYSITYIDIAMVNFFFYAFTLVYLGILLKLQGK